MSSNLDWNLSEDDLDSDSSSDSGGSTSDDVDLDWNLPDDTTSDSGGSTSSDSGTSSTSSDDSNLSIDWNVPDDTTSDSGGSTSSDSGTSSTSSGDEEPDLDPDDWLKTGASDGASMETKGNQDQEVNESRTDGAAAENDPTTELDDETLRQRERLNQTNQTSDSSESSDSGGEQSGVQRNLERLREITVGATTPSTSDEGSGSSRTAEERRNRTLEDAGGGSDAPPTAEEFNEQQREQFVRGEEGTEGVAGGVTARLAQSDNSVASAIGQGVRANVYDYTTREGTEEVSEDADEAGSGPVGAVTTLPGRGADFVTDNPSLNIQRGTRRTYNAATGQTGERGATEDLTGAFQAVSSTGERGVRALREGNEVRYSAFGQEVSVDAGGLNPSAGPVSAADVGEFGRRAFIEDPARGISRTVLGIDPQSGERNVDPRTIDVAETAFSATGGGSVVRGAARAGQFGTRAARRAGSAAADASRRATDAAASGTRTSASAATSGSGEAAEQATRASVFGGLAGRGATEGAASTMSFGLNLIRRGAQSVGSNLGGRFLRTGSRQTDNLPVVRESDNLPTRPENLNIRAEGNGPIEVEQTASAADNLPEGLNSQRNFGQGTPRDQLDLTRSQAGGAGGVQNDVADEIDGTINRLTSRGEPEVQANQVRGDRGANAPAEGGNNLPVPASQSDEVAAGANQVDDVVDESRGAFGQVADSLRTLSPAGGGTVSRTIRRITPGGAADDAGGAATRFADEGGSAADDTPGVGRGGRGGDDATGTRSTTGDGTTTRSTGETPPPGGRAADDAAEEGAESLPQRIGRAIDDALGRGSDDAARGADDTRRGDGTSARGGDEGGGIFPDLGNRNLISFLGGASLVGAGAVAYGDLQHPPNLSGDGWRASKVKSYRDSSGQTYADLYEVRGENGSPLGYAIVVGVSEDGTIYILEGVEQPSTDVSAEKATGLEQARRRAAQAAQGNIGGGQ